MKEFNYEEGLKYLEEHKDEIDTLMKKMRNEEDDDNVLSYGCSNPDVERGWLCCDGYCPTCHHSYKIYKNR